MTTSVQVLRLSQQLLRQGAVAAGAAATGLQRLQPLPAVPGLQLRRFAADAPPPLPETTIIPLSKQSTAPQARPDNAAAVAERNKGPWTLVQDQATGGSYWWNESTGVTTPVGAPKPDAWVAVSDKHSGQTYYWNQQSGDTTAVGEPLPGPEGRLVVAAQQQMQQAGGRAGAVQVLANSLAAGFGIGLVFALIRMVF